MEHRRTTPCTFYKAKGWDELLHQHGLSSKYPRLVMSLQRVLMLEFERLVKPLPLLMAPLWIYMSRLSKRLSTESLLPSATSAHYLETRLNNLLALSNHPCYPWFWNLAKWPGFRLFIIFLTLTSHQANIFPSTTSSIQTCTLVHGALSVQFALLYTIYLQAPRLLSEMWPNPTTPYPSLLGSGLALSLNCELMTPTASTPMIILVWLSWGCIQSGGWCRCRYFSCPRDWPPIQMGGWSHFLLNPLWVSWFI